MRVLLSIGALMALWAAAVRAAESPPAIGTCIGCARDGAQAVAAETAALQPMATGGTVARSQADHSSDAISIMDFGAICDGTPHPLSTLGYTTLLAAQQMGYPAATSLSDEADWAAMQQALNTEPNVLFPPRGCMQNKHLTQTLSGQFVHGTEGSTKIINESATDHAVVLGSGQSLIENDVWADIGFWASTQKTGGAVFYGANTVARMTLRNVDLGDITAVATVGNLLYDGIELDTAEVGVVNGYTFGEISLIDDKINVSHRGIAIANGSEFSLSGSTRVHGALIGLEMEGNVGGVRLANGVNIDGNGTAIQTDITVVPTIPNRELIMDSAALDSNTGYSINVLANSLVVLKATGTWMAASPVCLAVAPGQPAGAEFEVSGAHIDSCSVIGISANDGLWTINDSIFTQDATAANGTPYFALYYTSALGGSITGNTFANNGPQTGATGNHDVCFCGGTPDYFTFTGNTLRSSPTGTVEVDPGTAANRRIVRSNVGVADSSP